MLVVRADAGLVDLRAEPELAEVIRRFELAMYIGPRGALLLRGLDREDVLLHRDGNFFSKSPEGLPSRRVHPRPRGCRRWGR